MKLVLPSLDPCGPIHKYLYLVRSGGACSERDMNNVEASHSRGKTYQLSPLEEEEKEEDGEDKEEEDKEEVEEMNNVEASHSRGKTYQLSLPCLAYPVSFVSFSRKAFLVNFRFNVAAPCATLRRKTLKAWRERDMANGGVSGWALWLKLQS